MSNKVLTSEDFEGRLNMDTISNFKKALSEQELQKAYPSTGFQVFEKSDIDEFIKKTYESIGGEIKKGGFNDTEETHKLIKKAEEQIKALKPVEVRKGDTRRTVFILPKHSDDLKKGQVVEAFSWNNELKFKKKGKEIKEKLATEVEKIESICIEKEADIRACLEKCPFEPQVKYNSYHSVDIPCPYKVFDWSQTYMDEGVNFDSERDMSYEKCNSDEDCQLLRKYNNCVSEYMDCKRESKLVKMLKENLEDASTYELDARQMMSLGF